jgi:hypothetical protein
VGIAHTYGTPLVMLLRQGQKLPSDLAHLRTVFYDIQQPAHSVNEVKKQIEEFMQKDWVPPLIVPGAMSRQRFKYDVFISAPMTSVPSDQYSDLRSKVLILKQELKKRDMFRRIYSALDRIKKVGKVEPPSYAFKQDIKALRSSKYYVLLYPSRVPTSAVVEAGYALAMGKPSAYLYRNREDLPFMLQEAGVQMLDYNENNFRHQCMHIHPRPPVTLEEKAETAP